MNERPTTAFVLSLLAGLWMLATGGMMYGMGLAPDGGFTHDGFCWMWGHPGVWGHGMMWNIGPGWQVPWFGAASGVIVLAGSAFLYSRPEQSQTWGLVILITAALNLLVGMGGLPAGTLGVIGGALAMSWKPGSKNTVSR